MNYYSTNGKAPIADLQKAVVKGLAEDRGLYMPERIEKLPKAFFDNIQDMKFHSERMWTRMRCRISCTTHCRSIVP